MKVKHVFLGLASLFMMSAVVPFTHAAEKAKVVDVGNTICPVSGEKIDAASGMAPATYEHSGKLYHFCCPGCIAKFKQDPDKYGKIAEDQAASLKTEVAPAGHQM